MSKWLILKTGSFLTFNWKLSAPIGLIWKRWVAEKRRRNYNLGFAHSDVGPTLYWGTFCVPTLHWGTFCVATLYWGTGHHFVWCLCQTLQLHNPSPSSKREETVWNYAHSSTKQFELPSKSHWELFVQMLLLIFDQNSLPFAEDRAEWGLFLCFFLKSKAWLLLFPVFKSYVGQLVSWNSGGEHRAVLCSNY